MAIKAATMRWCTGSKNAAIVAAFALLSLLSLLLRYGPPCGIFVGSISLRLVGCCFLRWLWPSAALSFCAHLPACLPACLVFSHCSPAPETEAEPSPSKTETNFCCCYCHYHFIYQSLSKLLQQPNYRYYTAVLLSILSFPIYPVIYLSTNQSINQHYPSTHSLTH